MASAVPKVIKNFNFMVDGVGFAGIIDEVTLPVLSIKAEEHRGGGLDIPVQLDMGMEKLELKFSMAEHSSALFKKFGLQSGNALGAIFRAAKSDDKVVEAYIVTIRGSFKDLTPGAIRPGEKTPLTGTIALRYYKLAMGGRDIIEIDIDNLKRIIDGVDVLAGVRNAISL